jgi:FAD/FMN-containing dehydrogenase
MGLFSKKSDAEKQRKDEIKDAKKDARDDKQDARQDARAEKKDARQDARDESQEARQDAREEKKDSREKARDDKQDAREDKRDAMQDIRQSDLRGETKRDEKAEVRDIKRDAVHDAKDDKRDGIDDAKNEKRDIIDLATEEKKDQIADAKDEKKETLEDIREAKREALASLRVPKAFDRNWKSYLSFQTVKALEIYKPESLEHLQTICRIATDNDLKIRAIGSGHSFSQIGITDDIFVETHALNRMLPLGQDERRRRFRAEHHDPAASAMAEFEIGVTIVELSKALETSGHALFNQGTYDGQTFWGAVSTSTHGSGLRRNAFPEMVLSFVLVGESGRTYRIEPHDGVTDPSSWLEPGIDELIQDDDVFYSAVCSFGCMGIVYSAIIKVRDFYWMDEWTFITTWEMLKSTFGEPSALRGFLEGWDDVSLLVAPSQAKRGEKDGIGLRGEYPVSITLRSETEARRVIGANYIDDIAKAFEDIGIISGKAPAEGRWWRPNLTNLKRDDAWLARMAVRNTGKRGWSGEAIDPNEMPPIRRRDKCYEMFPKGGKLFGGYGIELAFPVGRTIEVMDQLIPLAEANDAKELYHTAPIAIRFVAPGTAYASPQYGRPTVMFEVLMAKGTEGGAEALALIEEAMLRDPEMRVHWGLHMDRLSSRTTDFNAMYPRWNAFRETFQRFNRHGTFRNVFTDRIGLD